MTANLLARLAAERPVVVMGRGHSGTRVLAWALEAAGIRLGTLPEKPTGDTQDRRFTGTIKRIAASELARPALAAPEPADVRRFARSAARFLRWLDDRARDRACWGFKFPEAYLIGNVVDAVFPLARYIHMVRDGRDLAFKEHLTDDEGRHLGRRLLRHLDALGKPRHIQAALSWDFQVRRFSDFETKVPGRVLRLTFERLVEDPGGAMADVCAFVGVPYSTPCREWLAANLKPGKVRQHREADRERIREVEALIAPTLRAWGYPPGDA